MLVMSLWINIIASTDISTLVLNSLLVPLRNKICNQPSNHTWQKAGLKYFKLSRLPEAYPHMCWAVLCLVAQSCATLCDPMDCSPPSSSVHGDSPGKNTGVGVMPFCRGSSQSRDQTQVSHIVGGFWATREVQEYWLKWVSYPFPRGSSQPRIEPDVSCIAGVFCTSWADEWSQLFSRRTRRES